MHPARSKEASRQLQRETEKIRQESGHTLGAHALQRRVQKLAVSTRHYTSTPAGRKYTSTPAGRKYTSTPAVQQGARAGNGTVFDQKGGSHAAAKWTAGVGGTTKGGTGSQHRQMRRLHRWGGCLGTHTNHRPCNCAASYADIPPPWPPHSSNCTTQHGATGQDTSAAGASSNTCTRVTALQE